MRLNTRGNDKATMVGGRSLGTYRINANKMAFETLSSRLYSDKIRAVIRELSCNAWDAHAAAGKLDVPFEIHLPTSFEPWFEIRDFGTGLSHINIVDLFCTYFGTNKSDSNQFIGALGLGSKSPFCLTIKDPETGRDEAQGFSITDRFRGDTGKCTVCGKLVLLVAEWMRDPKRQNFTRKPIEHEIGRISEKIAFDPVDTDEFDSHIGCGGVGLLPEHGEYEGWQEKQPMITRNYDAVIEESEPKLSLMTEEETPDAPIGISVRFDVPQESIWEFENKAQIALEFFQPRPILNIEGFDIPSAQYSIKTERWGMRTEAKTEQTSTVRAIQGNVQYAVGTIDISRTTDYQKKLLEMPIDIFFPIGSLDPAVSRETLELNERTIKALLDALDEVFKGMMVEVKRQIAECKYPWEARIMVYNLSHAEGVGKLVNDAWNRGELFGKYDNFTLSDKKPVINDLDMEGLILTRFARNNRDGVKRAGKDVVTALNNPQARVNVISAILNGTAKKGEFDHILESEPTVQFIVNDLKVGGEKYVHHYIQIDDTNDKTIVYLFNRLSKDFDPKFVVKAAKKAVKSLGNPPLILMSELKAMYPQLSLRNTKPHVPREKRTIVTLRMSLGRPGRRYRGKGWIEAWEKSEDQPSGTKYYVSLERLKAVDSGFESAYDLVDFCRNVQLSGYFGLSAGTPESEGVPAIPATPIYGLRKNSKLRHDPEWVELTAHVMNSVPSLMAPEKELELSYLLDPFKCDHLYMLEKIGSKKLLYTRSPLQQFCNALVKAKAKENLADQALYRVLKVAIGRQRYTVSNTISFDNQWEEMKKMYPLLNIDWYDKSNSEVIRRVVEYLDTIDSINGVTSTYKAKTMAAAAASTDGTLEVSNVQV